MRRVFLASGFTALSFAGLLGSCGTPTELSRNAGSNPAVSPLGAETPALSGSEATAAPFELPKGYEVRQTSPPVPPDGESVRSWEARSASPLAGATAASIVVTELTGGSYVGIATGMSGSEADRVAQAAKLAQRGTPVAETIGGRAVVAVRDFDLKSGADLGLPDRRIELFVVPNRFGTGVVEIFADNADADAVTTVIESLGI